MKHAASLRSQHRAKIRRWLRAAGAILSRHTGIPATLIARGVR